MTSMTTTTPLFYCAMTSMTTIAPLLSCDIDHVIKIGHCSLSQSKLRSPKCVTIATDKFQNYLMTFPSLKYISVANGYTLKIFGVMTEHVFQID